MGVLNTLDRGLVEHAPELSVAGPGTHEFDVGAATRQS